MLVLRRRAGECLLIGDDVEIELLAITPQGAKIGIRAPRNTIILRKELKLTQEQNEAAAQALAPSDFNRAMEELRDRREATGRRRVDAPRLRRAKKETPSPQFGPRQPGSPCIEGAKGPPGP